MRRWTAMRIAIGAILLTSLGMPGLTGAGGQEPKAAPRDSIAAIDAEFERESLNLEKVRLERLARLASSKSGAESDLAYETYFRNAIANNLYGDAEPIAQLVLKGEDASSQVAMMAQLVSIVAEANRGAYAESLARLEAALNGSKAGRKSSLPLAMKLTLVDAYLQRLIRGEQFDVARTAIRSIREKTEDPAVKDYLARRLPPLDLVGQPAPPIAGTDVDGQPYRLAESKGNVVLVVFWATWFAANSQELPALSEVYNAHRDKGLRIVGVNLDAFQVDARSAEVTAPNIKRFLIERNVRWPNLIDHPGERELAKAYGVTDLPANFLIAKDGTVVAIDLTRANLNKIVTRELAR